MNLAQLKAPDPMRKTRKRIGRGPASGSGCTAGKGNKGQRSRAGYTYRPGFEGGQMPLQRRIPKFGFHNIFRTEYQVVNTDQLNRLKSQGTITRALLHEKGLIKRAHQPVKLLAKGPLQQQISIEVDACSHQARTLIEQAGGKVILP